MGAGKMRQWTMAALLAAAVAIPAWGQPAPSMDAAAATTDPAGSKLSTLNPAEQLYLQLRNVGLDPARVYHIREAEIDRSAIQITFEDGTIAFTADVAGQVTGAFFQGTGEVLIMPPNQVERASMALFTRGAILEEQFSSGYFRFNDQTFAELQPALRPAENAAAFVEQWNDTARNLASDDALRLFMTFSRLLPEAASSQPAGSSAAATDDRMLHARLEGQNLGAFDVFFDSRAAEQIWAGQLRTTAGVNYYDVWTSFTAPASAAQPSQSSQYSTVVEENSEQDEVHIASYKIQAEVKPPTQLRAEARLQMDVRGGGERAVLFELSRSLEVESVEANGHPVEFIHNPALEGTQLARHGDDMIAVVFPHPLQAGQKIELRFTYHGDVLSAAGGGLLYVGARGIWYPNRGLASATFDLDFRYPREWALVATGKREGLPPGASPATQPDQQESRWVSDRPIPVAGFNLGKYSHAEARAGAVAIETYASASVEKNFPQVAETLPAPQTPSLSLHKPPVVEVVPLPPSPARQAAEVSGQAARAVEFLAQHFGPFPYSSLSLTQMPGFLSQGWPGLIFLSSYNFLTPQEQAALHMGPLQQLRSRSVIAHETAHQWWGDLVGWSSYRDQWVVEGLSEYSALMLEETQDPKAFRAVLNEYRDDLLAKNKDGTPLMEDGPVSLGGRLSNSHFPLGYETISYERGAWLFHMLRTMLQDAEAKTAHGRPEPPGDDPFDRALRRLRQNYQGRAITTRQMLREFEAELPRSLQYEGRKSLDWFYDGWINGTAIPGLELQNAKYTDRAGSTLVRGTIVQKEAPEDLVTCVPVYASLGNKSVLLGRVFADGASTDFHLTAPAHTRKVVLDPKGTLLTRK